MKNAFRIRGIRDTSEPRAACPTCYADCTSRAPGDLIEFRCERGHVFYQTRRLALDHAKFVARFYSGQDRVL